MIRIVVAHRQKRRDKPLLLFAIEIGSRREHTMIVGRRGPYLTKSSFGHEMFFAHSVPERTTDSASVRLTVENCSYNFHLAGPRVTMFADVAVEAHRLKVTSFAHALLL